MSASTREEVFDNLKSLFEMAKSAARQRIADVSWPSTVPTDQLLIKRDSNPGTWKSKWHQAQRNVLAPSSGLPTHNLWPVLDEQTTAQAMKCAACIATMTGRNLPFWSPFGATSGAFLARPLSEGYPDYREYADDPTEWVLYRVVFPALNYHLGTLPSVDSANESAAEEFANDILRLVEQPNLTYQVSVPLSGLSISEEGDTPLTTGRATIRKLSELEQGDLFQAWGMSSVLGGVSLTLPMVILEAQVNTPRDAEPPDTRNLLDRWLCAFHLHGYSISGGASKFEGLPKWRMSTSNHTPIAKNSAPEKWSSLDLSDLQSLLQTVTQLGKYNLVTPASPQDLALHRFYSGAARRNPADAILDFVIALESLLLPYDESARHGDLGYRFQIHGAHYLSEKPSDRVNLAKKLTALYGLRSRLVHGGKYPTPAEISSGKQVADELARLGLRRALREGFPTAATLKQMALGQLT
ncbi:hypothetical protein ACWEGE_15700 [Amycolatopsis sp. NPDC004747]